MALGPTEADQPFVRSLVMVHKTSSQPHQPHQTITRYDLSRRRPGRAQELAVAIRGQWAGSEIRHSWVRDALWAEDRTRSKNWRLNAVWAVWRAGLMGLGAAGATGAAFELADAL